MTKRNASLTYIWLPVLEWIWRCKKFQTDIRHPRRRFAPCMADLLCGWCGSVASSHKNHQELLGDRRLPNRESRLGRLLLFGAPFCPSFLLVDQVCCEPGEQLPWLYESVEILPKFRSIPLLFDISSIIRQNLWSIRIIIHWLTSLSPRFYMVYVYLVRCSTDPKSIINIHNDCVSINFAMKGNFAVFLNRIYDNDEPNYL